MTHRPNDLQAADTHVASVQRPGGVPHGDPSKIVLVDIAFHGGSVENLYTHRSAKFIPSPITRMAILKILGVLEYCELPHIRRTCLLRLNGQRLKQQGHLSYSIQHADYVRVDLPPHPQIDVPPVFIAKRLREGMSFRRIPNAFANWQYSDTEWETISDEEECMQDEISMLQKPPSAERLIPGPVAHIQEPRRPGRYVLMLAFQSIPKYMLTYHLFFGQSRFCRRAQLYPFVPSPMTLNFIQLRKLHYIP